MAIDSQMMGGSRCSTAVTGSPVRTKSRHIGPNQFLAQCAMLSANDAQNLHIRRRKLNGKWSGLMQNGSDFGISPK
jgi:hypothetical protein